MLESARLILENNNCKLNDEFFVQINGTGIRTTFAPAYAMLSIGCFELTFIRICNNELGETLGQFSL